MLFPNSCGNKAAANLCLYYNVGLVLANYNCRMDSHISQDQATPTLGQFKFGAGWGLSIEIVTLLALILPTSTDLQRIQTPHQTAAVGDEG